MTTDIRRKSIRARNNSSMWQRDTNMVCERKQIRIFGTWVLAKAVEDTDMVCEGRQIRIFGSRVLAETIEAQKCVIVQTFGWTLSLLPNTHQIHV